MESVGNQIARGSAWMLLFKMADRTLAVLSTAILARLLTPADFGLVAMATALIAAIELLMSFGFDIALLRDREVSRVRYDSAWTLNVLLALGCALLMLAATVPAVHFYSEPRLATLIPLLALGTAISGFDNIGTVAFRKELDFRREFMFLTAKRLAVFCAAVPLAYLLRNYWALAFGIIASRLGGVVISYLMHSYRPRWCLQEARQLFNFSKWLLLTNFIGFLQSRMPDFIIGRLFGPHQVGLYSTGADLARMPTTEIAAPINRAVYPGYAQQAHDARLLGQTYLEVASAIWTLALPASLGLWVVAQPFVLLFLGAGWLEMVPVVRVLAFMGLCSLTISNQFYVYLALGKSYVVTRLAMLQMAVSFVGIMMLLPRHGIVGAAYGMLMGAALDVPLSFLVFQRMTGLRWTPLVLAAWRPILATAVMVAVLVALHPHGLEADIHGLSAAHTLITAAVTGAVVYVAILLLAWTLTGRPPGPESRALAIVQRRLLPARAQPRT